MDGTRSRNPATNFIEKVSHENTRNNTQSRALRFSTNFDPDNPGVTNIKTVNLLNSQAKARARKLNPAQWKNTRKQHLKLNNFGPEIHTLSTQEQLNVLYQK
jgi:hypothetical protein